MVCTHTFSASSPLSSSQLCVNSRQHHFPGLFVSFGLSHCRHSLPAVHSHFFIWSPLNGFTFTFTFTFIFRTVCLTRLTDAEGYRGGERLSSLKSLWGLREGGKNNSRRRQTRNILAGKSLLTSPHTLSSPCFICISFFWVAVIWSAFLLIWPYSSSSS